MNCQTFKSNVRREKLKNRLALSKQEVETKSREISLLAFTNFFLIGKEVGLYFPINNEVNPLFLTEYGINFTSLPCIVEKKIIFKKWQKGDELTTSSLKTQEPAQSAKEVMPEILIVPLLAFDNDKNRIGYGGGYYDRFLAGFNGVSIGFAYDFQIVDKIPKEDFDINLDYIVTETTIYE